MKKIFATLITCIALITTNANAFPIIGKGTVYKVSDGDTYIINIGAKEFRQFQEQASNNSHQYLYSKYKSVKMRLAGANTPESNHVDPSKNTESGKRVSAIVKQALTGADVEYRCTKWGYYGRPICSVSANGVDVAKWLIDNNYAQPY
ncbi:thermonuclease family protein [Neptuniibacter sp. QD37_11]|uniref:thermonuclease family protein n=1 Tax=Neptuniibacter sp. QD37_11 TaxID=3398209 RepID=UPI0039F4811B